MSNCAGSVVIACAIIHAFAVQTPRLESVVPGAMAQYAFVSHHKTGTILLQKIADDMATTLSTVYGWDIINFWPLEDWNAGFRRMTTADCDPHKIPLFQDMTAFGLQHFLETCPDTRMVHIIRRPASTLASNYLYAKAGCPEDEISPMQREQTAAPLLSRNLSSGIAWLCEEWRHTFFGGEQGMLETHLEIQKNVPNRIKEVRLEDFSDNFNKTSTTIFEHLLGKGHPMIHELVTKASKHDFNRQPALESRDHMSDPNDKREVEEMMKMLRTEGNSCMQQIQNDDAIMGYDDSFWSR